MGSMRSHGLWLALVAGVVFAACGTDQTPTAPEFGKGGTTPTVTATNPDTAMQDTTIDIQVSGSGFDNGSSAEWLLAGVPDSRVHANNTRFVSSSELIANVTIAIDAVPASYDVAVTTSGGKKGIGTEKFVVLAMEQLDAPAGNSSSRAVNADGVVVGSRAGGCSGALPVVWDVAGVLSDLPLPPGECSGIAQNINGSGVIVGTMLQPNGAVSARTMWIPGPSGYTAQPVEPLPGGVIPVADVQDLNAAGHMVANRNGGPGGSRPYWWSAETGFVEMALAPGATECYTHGINDLEEIVGICMVNGTRGAYWSSPTATPVLLPNLAGYNGRHSANDLNGNGIVVGDVMNVGKGGKQTSTAVRWIRSGTSWTVESLGGLGGAAGIAIDITESGWISGSATVSTGKYHAFAWIPGEGIRDLGSIGPESNAYGMAALAAGGQVIVVGSSDVGSVRRAVIWRP